jgi:radical SAM protein with 4Fe4S-binding SPASM domain
LKEVLEQVVFEITYKCNLKCAFCYNGWKDKSNRYKPEPEMNLEQYETVLDRLPTSKRYVLSGGEPLLRKDLFDIVDLMRTRADHVSVLTSGVDITDKIARGFGKRYVRAQFPIHGIRGKHDKITGRKGTFDRLIDGITKIREHGGQYSTSTVVTKANIKDLEDILEFSVAMGSKYLYLIRFLPGGQGSDRNDLLLTQKEIKKSYDVLEKVCKYYGLRGGIGVPNLPCIIKVKRYKHIDFNVCLAGKNWFAVDPSGNLRICNHSPTKYGNLLETPFEEIMKNKTLRLFQKDKIYPKECTGCKDLKDCRGGCRAVAETMYNDLRKPDPMFVC